MTAWVPKANLPQLQKKIEALNKRATKLQLPPVTMTLGATERRKVTVVFEDDAKTIETACVEVTVNGDLPVLPGWNLKAVIEHDVRLIGQYNVLRIAPGYELDPKYRTCEPTCDHCGTKRFRNTTFLLWHATDQKEIQVGSSCVDDFLAKYAQSPEYITAVATYLKILEGLFRDTDRIGGGSFEYDFPILDVMAVAARYIRKFGWFSRGYVKDNGGEATADRVKEYFFDLVKGERKDKAPTAEDYAVAEAALAWLETHDIDDRSLSDYMYNCLAVAKAEHVRFREMGLITSVIASHKRHLTKLAEAANKKESNWFGNVDDRVDVDVTFLKAFYFDSHFGTTAVAKFVTPEGNLVVWKTSGYRADFEEGKRYKLTGTIKKHDEYRNEKQTVLTRCKAKEA